MKKVTYHADHKQEFIQKYPNILESAIDKLFEYIEKTGEDIQITKLNDPDGSEYVNVGNKCINGNGYSFSEHHILNFLDNPSESTSDTKPESKEIPHVTAEQAHEAETIARLYRQQCCRCGSNVGYYSERMKIELHSKTQINKVLYGDRSEQELNYSKLRTISPDKKSVIFESGEESPTIHTGVNRNFCKDCNEKLIRIIGDFFQNLHQ